MKDILSIRAQGETKETLKKIAEYIGGELGTKVSSGQALEIMCNRMLRTYEREFLNSQFFASKTDEGWVMTEAGTKEFAKLIDRAELDMSSYPGTYLKAVQASCHSLGFDPKWVEQDLWAELRKLYLDTRKSETQVDIKDRDMTDAEKQMWLCMNLLPIREEENDIGGGQVLVYSQAHIYGERPDITKVDRAKFRDLSFDDQRIIRFYSPSGQIDLGEYTLLNRKEWKALQMRMEELGWH